MQPWMESVIRLILLGGMLVGLFGLIVPVFPGHTVIWAATGIYGLIFGFETWGLVLFIVLTLLTIVGTLVDNVFMGAKALEKGAHWISLVVAMLTGLVGSVLLTPIGGIFTAMLGLYLAEYLRRKDADEAWEVTKGMAIGWGWAFVVRFIIGLMMIGVWVIWTMV